MAHIVFTTSAAAQAFSAGIDADFGFPLDGVRMGGGAHGSRAQGRTTRYASVDKRRTSAHWAYPEDPVIVGKEARVPIGTASRQTLDASWNDRIPDV